MKWIEIIRISMAENSRVSLEKQISSIKSKLNTEENIEEVKFYRNLLDGDLSIHLCWNNGKAEPMGSKTGLCLAHLLKEFGITSHSSWVEKEE